MCTRGPVKQRTPGKGPRRAFTLLEVMIAVVIISMLMISVFRFVKTVLTAVQVSTSATVTQQEVVGLMNFLQLQLEDLPAKTPNALLGTPHSYNNLASDELEYTCVGGHGVLTAAAPDQYRVTLAIQNVKEKPGELEIGLRRRSVRDDERSYNWLPLLRPAVALEVRYWDGRQKEWIDAWRDPAIRPSLVRVRVWRAKDQPPYEAIIALPSARAQNL